MCLTVSAQVYNNPNDELRRVLGGVETANPNPYFDNFRVQIKVPKSGKYSLVLVNSIGKILAKEEMFLTRNIVSLKTISPQLPAGIYTIQLLDANASILSNQKIVKQ